MLVSNREGLTNLFCERFEVKLEELFNFGRKQLTIFGGQLKYP